MSDVANPPASAAVKTSHPIGFWFFFWGEFAERCSYYGMRAILALYMTKRLGVDEKDAATFMSLFIAACYFFPLIGGYVADNYLGKYWTIVAFSVPYVFGQFIVGIENKYFVVGALILLAMGSGVIKPNISTLMGLTYDQQRPGQTQLRTNAFSWFYLAINIGAGLSQFAMPWLRNNRGFQTAFLFPAVFMSIALVIFALGKPFYAVEKIERKKLSPEEAALDWQLKKTTFLQIGALFGLVVFFWGIFDQSASTWIFFADTYMESIMFGDLSDGSKMIVSGETLKGLIGSTTFGLSADAVQAFNATFIVILVPISVFIFKKFPVKATNKLFIGFIFTGSTMAIMSVAGFLGGTKQETIRITLNNQAVLYAPMPVSGTELKDAVSPAGNLMLKLGDLTLECKKAVYNPDNKIITFTDGKLIAPGNAELVIENKRINFVASEKLLQNGEFRIPGSLEARWDAGVYPKGNDTLLITTHGKVEVKAGEKLEVDPAKELNKVEVAVVEWVPPSERVSIWWQVFAYLILTIGEILISITGLELAFVAAPPTMKSFVTACWLATVFVANFVVNIPVTRLWGVLPPSYYFLLLAVMMFFVTLLLIPVARRFDRVMAEKEAMEKAQETTTETV